MYHLTMEDNQYSTIFINDKGTHVTFKINNPQTMEQRFDIITRIIGALDEKNNFIYGTKQQPRVQQVKVDNSNKSNSTTNSKQISELEIRPSNPQVQKKNKNKKKRIQQLKDSINCIICKENKREILFTPCNHICGCEECSTKILDKCIVCNAVIQNKIKVYFP